MSDTYHQTAYVLAIPVLGPCVPLGVGDDLSVFSCGVVTVVGVVGVPLPSTVIGVNITGLSVQKGLSAWLGIVMMV